MRSCMRRAVHTFTPFMSRANTGAFPAACLAVAGQAADPESVPVLARQRPDAAVPRMRLSQRAGLPGQRQRAVERVEPGLVLCLHQHPAHGRAARSRLPRDRPEPSTTLGATPSSRCKRLTSAARRLRWSRSCRPGAEALQQHLGVVVVRHLVGVAHQCLERRRLGGREGDRVGRRLAGAAVGLDVDLLRSQHDAHPLGRELGGSLCQPRASGSIEPG